jgi:hypothetical protein
MQNDLKIELCCVVPYMFRVGLRRGRDSFGRGAEASGNEKHRNSHNMNLTRTDTLNWSTYEMLWLSSLVREQWTTLRKRTTKFAEIQMCSISLVPSCLRYAKANDSTA